MQITLDFNAIQKLIHAINNISLKAWVASLTQDIPANLKESNQLLQDGAESFTEVILTNLENILCTVTQIRDVIEKGKITEDGEKKKVPIDDHDQALLRTLCSRLESIKDIKETLKQKILVSQIPVTGFTWQTQALYYEQDLLFKDETIQQTLNQIKQTLQNTKSYQCHCFISYAWPSQQNQEKGFWLQPFLVRLRKQLRQAGVQTFLDIEDHKPGCNRYELASQAENSEFVLLVCTESLLEKHRNNNEIVTTELNHIEAKCKLDNQRGLTRVFPVNGTQQSSYPEKFHNYLTVQDWRGKSYLTHLNDLLKWILHHPYQDQLLENHSDSCQAMKQEQVAGMQCHETYRQLSEELKSQPIWQGLSETSAQKFLKTNSIPFQSSTVPIEKIKQVVIEKESQEQLLEDELIPKEKTKKINIKKRTLPTEIIQDHEQSLIKAKNFRTSPLNYESEEKEFRIQPGELIPEIPQTLQLPTVF